MRVPRCPPLRVLALWGLALAAGATPASPSADAAPPCPRAGDTVVVLTGSHELWLCTDGGAAARYPVAIGRGGAGKRRRGDGRTPVGAYLLGAPRPSAEYGIFIPVGFPTAAQAGRGFTGGAVGIHGPPRGKEAPDYPVTEVDWTLGCIATGTDAEVAAIAEFVRVRRAGIVIR
jgi:murein L,D-transpeptidase YafK